MPIFPLRDLGSGGHRTPLQRQAVPEGAAGSGTRTRQRPRTNTQRRRTRFTGARRPRDTALSAAAGAQRPKLPPGLSGGPPVSRCSGRRGRPRSAAAPPAPSSGRAGGRQQPVPPARRGGRGRAAACPGLPPFPSGLRPATASSSRAMGAAAGGDAQEGSAAVAPLDPERGLPLPRAAGSPAASQDKLFLIKGADSPPPFPSLACAGQGPAAAGAPWPPPGTAGAPAGREAFPYPALQ